MPYRTILAAFIFFIIGTALILWGLIEWSEKGIGEAYEKLLLGALLFIPGSFHTFLAVMAATGQEGYNYEHLTTFEGDDFFNED